MATISVFPSAINGYEVRENAMAQQVSQQAINNEIHKPLKDEDPKFVSDQLNKMKQEIEKILKTNKTIKKKKNSPSEYEMAMYLAPNKYLTDDTFHKMFLRAANYNPHVAANNCILHFIYKAELFGSDKVAKDISIDEDLDENDKEALYSGWVQYITIPLNSATAATAVSSTINSNNKKTKYSYSNKATCTDTSTIARISNKCNSVNDKAKPNCNGNNGICLEVISPRNRKFKSWRNQVSTNSSSYLGFKNLELFGSNLLTHFLNIAKSAMVLGNDFITRQ